MNDLASRKRLLIAQTELHRQLIALERLQLQARWVGTRERARTAIADRRWWLVGGALVAGVLLTRASPRLRNLLGWGPTVLAALRGLQR